MRLPLLAAWNIGHVVRTTPRSIRLFSQSRIEIPADLAADPHLDSYGYMAELPHYKYIKSDIKYLPDPKSNLPTLVLDIDETLVHSSESEGDEELSLLIRGRAHKMRTYRRPYVQQFLQAMQPHYELVLFTAGIREYAEAVRRLLDPNNAIFAHCLARENCTYCEGLYLKDLAVVNRDLRRTAILDNSPVVFGFHINNGIPIKSFEGEKNDEELKKMEEFLLRLKDEEDFRPHIEKEFRVQQKVDTVRELTKKRYGKK